MPSRIFQYLKDAGTPGESNTDRDGFLSHAEETHALVIGTYHGLITLRPWDTECKSDNPDAQAQPHYYKGGFILGNALKVVLLALFIRWGIPLL